MSKVRKNHWACSALTEFSINIIIIMLPFIVGFIKYKYYSGSNDVTNISAITDTFSVVAVTVLSATILAPIFYSIIKDPPIKFKAWFLLGSLIIYTLGVVIYGFEINLATKNDTLQSVTWVVLAGALILYMFNTFANNLSNYSESAPAILDKKIFENLNDYKRHRGQ